MQVSISQAEWDIMPFRNGKRETGLKPGFYRDKNFPEYVYYLRPFDKNFPTRWRWDEMKPLLFTPGVKQL